MAAGAQKTRLGRGLASLIGGFEQAWRRRRGASAASRSARSSPGGSTRGGISPSAARRARGLDPRARAGAAARGPAVRCGDTYEIVAGERRWRAAQLASLHEVPVVVRALTRSGSGRDRHHRERPARGPERDRGGGGLQAADGRPRLHAGGPRQGHRQEPQPSRQHAAPAEAARGRAGAGAGGRAQRRPCPRAGRSARRCGACGPHR